MNVLSMGQSFGADNSILDHYVSRCGHEVRTLAAEGEADYSFEAAETASQVVERVSRTWPPDLLMCWLPELFPPPREVEGCPIKTAAVVSDWNIYYPQLEYNLARYDVVVTDKLGARTLRPPGATPRYFGPLYSQRSRVHRKLSVEKDIDVAFAGNLNHAVHVARGRCLEVIASLPDRYRVVICNGYEDEAYTRLLNRARIVFNHSIRREMNLRCFEALACGSLLFLEKDNLEVGDWLRDRDEVVLYHRDNLASLIEDYLERPEDAARIARQGHAKAAALAGENRLDDLLNRLEGQPIGPRAYRQLPEADRMLADIFHYGSSLVAGQRELVHETWAEALRRYPDRLEFLVAAACDTLGRLKTVPEAAKRSRLQDVLAFLREAADRAPQASSIWMNLAAVCRMGNAVDAEARFLELALNASSCAYGGLLLGRQDDPYYVAWRGAAAYRTQQVEQLWAAAAARLAVLLLDQERFERARDLARRAVEWRPGIAMSHRILARAESQSGNIEEAAAILARALPLTAFDSEFRLDLIRAWQALGRTTEARALAQESARLFAACPHAADKTQQFSDLARPLH